MLCMSYADSSTAEHKPKSILKNPTGIPLAGYESSGSESDEETDEPMSKGQGQTSNSSSGVQGLPAGINLMGVVFYCYKFWLFLDPYAASNYPKPLCFHFWLRLHPMSDQDRPYNARVLLACSFCYSGEPNFWLRAGSL